MRRQFLPMPKSKSGFNKIAVLSVLLLGLFFATSAAAAPLDDVLAQLSRDAESVESLYSPFVQQKHLAIFAETLESQGIFAYQSPDHLRWELLAPVGSGFVIRGKTGERWNSLSGEHDHFNIDSDPIMGLVSRQLLAWAGFDLAWLQQHYRIELLSEQPIQLKLTPLDAGEAAFISDLIISFDEQHQRLQSLTLNEQEGDWTRLLFSALQQNSELPATTFEVPDF